MSEKLLLHLLRQFEASPETKFYESDLSRISSSGFPVLKKLKYLSFDQYDFEQEHYYDKQGNERFVHKVNGKWLATSTEDSGVSPLYLKDQDLNRYVFNVQPLIAGIRSQNNLLKISSQITSRIHYVGEKTVLGNSVGIFVGFFCDNETAEAELLGLRSKIETVDNILVLCPSFGIASQGVLNKLANQNIVCLPFKMAFWKKKGYLIDFSKVQFNREIEQGVPILTAVQKADYCKYGYKCFDKIYIPGTKPRKKSNDLKVNRHKIKVPDEVFPLLIGLAVELKKGKGGWIVQSTPAGKYHKYERLRKPIEGSLLKKKAQDFLETDGSKGWRLSVHPDFVEYDRSQLILNYSGTVKALAKKLPKG